ncbi:MAG TPA: hypothetical protein VFZ65_01285 [Planctomycetota bacterium]|nr:hypothetical protein [Planctomycetota bacterium]
MPRNAGDGREAGNDGLRAAGAQWQRVVQTEVKRSSSLPTAMFDACDPMLETRLAESAESMLNRLHEPQAEVVAATDPTAEKRVERVEPAELTALPQRIAGPDLVLNVGSGLPEEYLAILTDMCCVATGPAQAGAANLLQRDFGLSRTTDVAELAQLLAQRVQGTEPSASDPVAEAALEGVCLRVNAALSLHLGDERTHLGDEQRGPNP